MLRQSPYFFTLRDKNILAPWNILLILFPKPQIFLIIMADSTTLGASQTPESTSITSVERNIKKRTYQMTDLERVAIWNRFREHLGGVMRGEVGGLGEKGSRAITCSYTGVFMPYYAVRIIQGVYYGSTIQYVFSEGICTAVRNKV